MIERSDRKGRSLRFYLVWCDLLRNRLDLLCL
jgi:hypothetical protein